MSFPQTFCAMAYFLQHTMGCSGILKTGVAAGGVWCPCNQAGAVAQAMLGSPTVPYCFVFYGSIISICVWATQISSLEGLGNSCVDTGMGAEGLPWKLQKCSRTAGGLRRGYFAAFVA